MKIGGAKFRRISKRRQKIQLKKQVKAALMPGFGREHDPMRYQVAEAAAKLWGRKICLIPTLKIRIPASQGFDQAISA
ncbi:hypothetical protein [Curvibacter lanceolatus]|uniref:hypothetical protein n=1 Tax=Curvibacter lanceolatus TaxID=86182 RepID=UPI00036BD202|nr:hypothetical protein [Curvibacter lanceolatus]